MSVNLQVGLIFRKTLCGLESSFRVETNVGLDFDYQIFISLIAAICQTLPTDWINFIQTIWIGSPPRPYSIGVLQFYLEMKYLIISTSFPPHVKTASSLGRARHGQGKGHINVQTPLVNIIFLRIKEQMQVLLPWASLEMK